jgi:hypothetical protein
MNDTALALVCLPRALQFVGRHTTTRPSHAELHVLVNQIWGEWMKHREREEEIHRSKIAEKVHLEQLKKDSSGKTSTNGTNGTNGTKTSEQEQDSTIVDNSEGTNNTAMAEIVQPYLDVPLADSVEGEDWHAAMQKARRTAFNRWLLGFFRHCSNSSTTATVSTHSAAPP